MLDKFRFKYKKGFTLIELIVVIAVLGILVLIGSPKIIGYVQKAELTRIQHDTKVMENKVAEVLNEDGSALFQWDDNAKDLGSLILKGQLYEKEGRASKVNKAHLIPSREIAVNGTDGVESQLLGIGGQSIPINKAVSTEDSNGDGYKIIPEILTKEIGTKLDGTFYSNELGKVYYEPNKPLKSIKNEQALACVTPESLDYEFSIKNGKGTITKYNGALTHLYIPGAFLLNIDGVEKCVPVQVIGSGAFRRGTFNKIEIPQSVVEINDGAFEDGQLTEVYIPHSVTIIGQNAFSGNPFKNNGVTVGSSADSVNLGSGAFGTTTPSYQIPTASGLQIVVGTKVNSSGVKTGRIESYYGSDSTGSTSGGLSGSGSGSGSTGSTGNTGGSGSSKENSDNQNKVVTIPSKVVVDGETIEITEIAKGAYQGQGIIYVGFPESLEIIEDYAFAGNQLIGVEIPEKVWSVGNYAFAYNEIEGERTMGYVEILNNDYVPQISDKTGNIELVKGTKTSRVGNTNLLDHVFVTSKGGFSVPETYVPISKSNFFGVPSKPIISSIDNVSAVVTGVAGTEVKLDNGEWQTSPYKFTGLTEGKVYKVYSRFKETDKYLASKESEPVSFEVKKKEEFVVQVGKEVLYDGKINTKLEIITPIKITWEGNLVGKQISISAIGGADKNTSYDSSTKFNFKSGGYGWTSVTTVRSSLSQIVVNFVDSSGGIIKTSIVSDNTSTNTVKLTVPDKTTNITFEKKTIRTMRSTQTDYRESQGSYGSASGPWPADPKAYLNEITIID